MSILEQARVGLKKNSNLEMPGRIYMNAPASSNENRFGFVSKTDENGFSVNLLANQELNDRIEEFIKGEGREPSALELFALAKTVTSQSYKPEFGWDEFAGFNELAYSTQIFGTQYEPASLFANNRDINETLGIFFALAAMNKSIKFARVKELAAGGNPNRWQFLTNKLPGFRVHATLTDFVPREEVTLVKQNLRLKRNVENMLKPPEGLRARDRFDVIFCTYAFDTLRSNQDRFFTYEKGQWFVHMFRLTHIDTFYAKSITAGFKQGIVGSVVDLQHLGLESVKIPFDMDSYPYGDLVKSHAFKEKKRAIHTAIGEADIISGYVARQLDPRGYFFSGDVHLSQDKYDKNAEPYYISGLGRFTIPDAAIAVDLLARRGYSAQVHQARDLTHSLRKGWTNEEHAQVDKNFPPGYRSDVEFLVVQGKDVK